VPNAATGGGGGGGGLNALQALLLANQTRAARMELTVEVIGCDGDQQ
jgi:hypothetical protein